MQSFDSDGIPDWGELGDVGDFDLFDQFGPEEADDFFSTALPWLLEEEGKAAVSVKGEGLTPSSTACPDTEWAKHSSNENAQSSQLYTMEPPNIGPSSLSPVTAGSQSSWISWEPPKHLEWLSDPTQIPARASMSQSFPGYMHSTSNIDAPSADDLTTRLSFPSQGMFAATTASLSDSALTLQQQPAAATRDIITRTVIPGDGIHAAAQPLMSRPCPSEQKKQQLSQLLLGDELLTQVAAQSTAGGRKGRGGRTKKQSSFSSTLATPFAKSALKDTTQRKTAQITLLEAEMQQKLSLVQKLEAEKVELQRKERLLKLQVSTGERTFMYQNMGDIAPRLASLLQGFRSSVNCMLAGKLIASLPKEGKDITPADFVAVWKTFVDEVSDIMLEESSSGRTADLEQRVQDLCDRFMGFVFPMALNYPTMMPRIQSMNMSTGEELLQPMEFWVGIVKKLELSEEQLADFHAVHGLYSNLLRDAMSEQHRLLKQLALLVDNDLQERAQGSKQTFSACSCPIRSQLDDKDGIIHKVQVSFRRCSTLYSMCSFLVMNLLTPWQRCYLVLHAFPSFPNPKMLMLAATGNTSTCSGGPIEPKNEGGAVSS